jgi:hypothetical protein
LRNIKKHISFKINLAQKCDFFIKFLICKLVTFLKLSKLCIFRFYSLIFTLIYRNRWTDLMFRSRSIFVDITGVRVHMSVRRGCPQGVVLSLLLWNMVADSLLNWLGNCNCFVQGLADDVVILISGKFLSTICDLMQRTLNCVQNWCGEIGLNINADRTSMVLFTKRRNFEGFFAPKLFD